MKACFGEQATKLLCTSFASVQYRCDAEAYLRYLVLWPLYRMGILLTAVLPTIEDPTATNPHFGDQPKPTAKAPIKPKSLKHLALTATFQKLVRTFSVYIYIYAHLYINIQIYIYIYMYIHIYMFMHTRVYKSIRACVWCKYTIPHNTVQSNITQRSIKSFLVAE